MKNKNTVYSNRWISDYRCISPSYMYDIDNIGIPKLNGGVYITYMPRTRATVSTESIRACTMDDSIRQIILDDGPNPEHGIHRTIQIIDPAINDRGRTIWNCDASVTERMIGADSYMFSRKIGDSCTIQEMTRRNCQYNNEDECDIIM